MRRALYSILILLLISCQPKPIDIEVTPAEPKLVAFTHVIPNNIMLVALSKSFSVLEGNAEENYTNLLISGATVQITFDNKVFSFYELAPGIYASYSEAYQVDQDYNFIAYIGLDTIRSTTKMLPKINFTSVLPQVEKSATDTNVYIDLSFTDIPNTSNWYLINVYKKQTQTDSADAVNYFNTGSNVLARSILISDKEFNGIYHKKTHFPELNYQDSIVVTLSNINESYYKYLNFKVGGGNVFNQLNIEPVNYPTNIINGYGFFNTHFPDIHFFDLSKF